jgi:hypothetical protein
MFASYHCLFVCEKKAAQYRNTGGVYKLLAYEIANIISLNTLSKFFMKKVWGSNPQPLNYLYPLRFHCLFVLPGPILRAGFLASGTLS